jgi:hypothetical protein
MAQVFDVGLAMALENAESFKSSSRRSVRAMLCEYQRRNIIRSLQNGLGCLAPSVHPIPILSEQSPNLFSSFLWWSVSSFPLIKFRLFLSMNSPLGNFTNGSLSTVDQSRKDHGIGWNAALCNVNVSEQNRTGHLGLRGWARHCTNGDWNEWTWAEYQSANPFASDLSCRTGSQWWSPNTFNETGITTDRKWQFKNAFGRYVAHTQKLLVYSHFRPISSFAATLSDHGHTVPGDCSNIDEVPLVAVKWRPSRVHRPIPEWHHTIAEGTPPPNHFDSWWRRMVNMGVRIVWSDDPSDSAGFSFHYLRPQDSPVEKY